MKQRIKSALALAVVLACAGNVWAADKPVKGVVKQRLEVNGATATLGLSQNWDAPLPNVGRVVIMVHGRLRNAVTYLKSAEKAAEAVHQDQQTLLIAPQFLDQNDVQKHNLDAALLHWHTNDWMGGLNAERPRPVSSFQVFDAILARLADRSRFPALREVVIAGHSGGAQVVQRYAIAAQGVDVLNKSGIGLRFVLANPSSYAWFSPDRPQPDANCAEQNQWKYGMQQLPPYVGQQTGAQLESAYTQRNIIYLLGEDDTDPNHPALDKSCAAEAQGAYRLIRGRNYFAYLSKRHPEGMPQQLVTVPGVAHNGDKIFNSPQGKAALFGH